MKKIAAAIAVITVLSLSAAMVSQCDTYTSDPDLRIFDGYVSAVDLEKGLLTVRGAISMEFRIDAATLLTGETDDNYIKLSDFEVGDYVAVSYYQLGPESQVSSKVVSVSLRYKGYGV